MFWKWTKIISKNSSGNFLHAKTQNLQQTREVIQECAKGLQPQIKAGLTKIDVKRWILRDYEAAIFSKRNFTYKFMETIQREVYLEPAVPM